MSNLKPLNELTPKDWQGAELYCAHVSLKDKFWGFGCWLEDAEGIKFMQYEIVAKLISRLETDSELPKQCVGEGGEARVVYARDPLVILETQYYALFSWLEIGVQKTCYIPHKKGYGYFTRGEEAYEAIYEHAQTGINPTKTNE